MPARDSRAPEGAGPDRPRGPLRAVGLAPGPPLGGRVSLPGSKSLAQRLLVTASLAPGATRLESLPPGDDVAAALALVEACGARVHTERGACTIARAGASGPGGWTPTGRLSAGESGTLARFASAGLALAAAPGTHSRLEAEGTLERRTSAPLFAALARAGAGITHAGRAGGWPVEIDACEAPDVLELEHPVSSQEASALAIAAAVHAPRTVLRIRGEVPSAPYLAMTLAVLERFGVGTTRGRRGAAEELRFTGKLAAPEGSITVEPDASSAAVALVAACISGGEVAVSGLGADSVQGDVRISEHVTAFGCRSFFERGALVAGGRPTRRAELDLSGEPDLAPPLAALAAARALVAPQGESPSVLSGLATLPRKESDRLAAIATALERLGLDVERGAAHLSIGRGEPATGAMEFDGGEDHRIVFFLALLGLARDGIRIRGSDAIDKSWPGFFRDLARLGAEVVHDASAL